MAAAEVFDSRRNFPGAAPKCAPDIYCDKISTVHGQIKNASVNTVWSFVIHFKTIYVQLQMDVCVGCMHVFKHRSTYGKIYQQVIISEETTPFLTHFIVPCLDL